MLSVAVPNDDAETIFVACATRTREVQRRLALLAQRGHVASRAALYLTHAGVGTLYQSRTQAPHGPAAAELSGLYDRVLVKGGERPLYDRLRAGSRYGRCPLCAQRDVKTLDHYLSKDDFPELAVFPANLAPSCFECNHSKRTYLACHAAQQLFHPYFDDWGAHRLVQADVDVSGAVSAAFSIRQPAGVDLEIVQRARQHFAILGLASLYSQHANVEMVERKEMFRRSYSAGGADALREELEFEARSRRRVNRNSWQAALYRSLARNLAFYNGGFELIDEP